MKTGGIVGFRGPAWGVGGMSFNIIAHPCVFYYVHNCNYFGWLLLGYHSDMGWFGDIFY